MANITVQTQTTAASGTSTPLDVSAFSTLRLNLAVKADLGRSPRVNVVIESAPSASGDYTAHRTIDFDAAQPYGTPRAWPSANTLPIVISGFASFVRVRWSAVATRNIGPADTSPNLSLALSGEGI